MSALLIPVDGPVREFDVDGTLEQLQGLVGGLIQQVPLPGFIKDGDLAAAYVNEEGKLDPDCKPNMRATDFMVPGVGLFFGDYIAGPMLLTGFDPRAGATTNDLPDSVVSRVRLIEREAA